LTSTSNKLHKAPISCETPHSFRQTALNQT
jgi:hypothetical protein